MNEEVTAQPPKKRRSTKYIVLGVLLLIGILVALKLNAPSKGTIVAHPKPITKQTKAATVPAAQQQSNAYYSLNLPTGFVNLAAANPAPGVLYSQSLTKQLALGHLIVTIGIKPLPDGGLSGDSNYQLRESQPGRYVITTQSVAGETVHIANDTQSSAVVAFWQHGSYLASISLTLGYDGPPSDGNASELTALQSILQGWQWQ